eukprot:TRINITY_DN23265_c0_g1_i3.p1 TRINITY_DN23265_c0_g1~~TRINITY_DN23265_c0_g1_i3.p1  ORF type:complete len:318 (-),score=50.60 TRINITY_DN23265_c0_g1_i3:148-1101(-)
MTEGLAGGNFDAVFVCVKCHDNAAAAPLKALAPTTAIVSLQNGVGNAEALAALLPEHTVVAGMVPYGIVEMAPGFFRKGTYGALSFSDNFPPTVLAALRRSGLAVVLESPDDMLAVQWGKFVINLGNALNALVGIPLAECLRDARYRLFLARIWEEGLAVMEAQGTRLKVDLNGAPLPTVIKSLRLPSFLLRVVQKLKGAKQIDPCYFSSMYYDLHHKRTSEIDALNGLLVDLASKLKDSNGKPIETPANQILSELVRSAQEAKQGSPGISSVVLLNRLEKVAPRDSSGSNLGILLCSAGVLAIGGVAFGKLAIARL